MTATRMGSPVRLLTIAALAALWAVAAYFLWSTTKVPNGLHLGGVSDRGVFGAHFLHRAQHYERFGYALFACETIVTLVVFGLYAWRGARFTRESAAGPIGTSMLLAMLGLALVWLVSVPFEVLSLWWQRRYDQSHESYGTVIFGGWLALGVEFVFLSVSVVIVVGLARLWKRAFWLPAAVVFVAIATLFTYIGPYLIPDTHPLRDPELRAAAAEIAKKEGVHGVPVRVQEVDTKDANAFTVGLFNSRKVFLWSSLLDGRFTNRQIEVVLAHEYGHQQRYHLLKGIAWYALFALPGIYLIGFIARRRGGLGEPEAMPLALLTLIVLNFVALPFQNTISRHMEAEADWVALQTTHDPQAMQGLFHRFATTGLTDPSPPTAAYLTFYDHPTMMQRIAMARVWARTHRTQPRAGS